MSKAHPPEVREKVIAAFLRGLTAAQVAAETGKTRSAVLHVWRGAKARGEVHSRKVNQPAPAPRVRAAGAALPGGIAPPTNEPMTLLDLPDHPANPRHCRYIVRPGYFCAAPTPTGSPWCPFHQQVVFSPDQRLARRRLEASV